MYRQIPVPETLLRDLLAHAASAARIVGHLDDALAVEPLADHVDAIVHELSELLGEPGPSAAVMPIARSSFDEQPTQVHTSRERRSDVGTALTAACTMAELLESGER